jgi:hypothetical protein
MSNLSPAILPVSGSLIRRHWFDLLEYSPPFILPYHLSYYLVFYHGKFFKKNKEVIEVNVFIITRYPSCYSA